MENLQWGVLRRIQNHPCWLIWCKGLFVLLWAFSRWRNSERDESSVHFVIYPNRNIGEGWKENDKLKASPPSSDVQHNVPLYCWCRSPFHFTLTVNKTLRPFSSRDPGPRCWSCWHLSQLLHSRLQTEHAAVRQLQLLINDSFVLRLFPVNFSVTTQCCCFGLCMWIIHQVILWFFVYSVTR